MKIELKRQLFAWLLLSVFVPMMAVAALHVHEEDSSAETACLACVNHQAHPGHLSNASGHLHDCVLCQLLHTSLLVASFVLLHLLSPTRCSLCSRYVADVNTFNNGAYGSRAPPAWIND